MGTTVPVHQGRNISTFVKGKNHHIWGGGGGGGWGGRGRKKPIIGGETFSREEDRCQKFSRSLWNDLGS